MTFYSRHVRDLNRKLYPRDGFTARIARAKRFMELNYAKNIDLDSVCGEACVSKYHFIRAFKRLYGRTPHQFLTEVRVAKAKELIRSGMTVRGACFAVGYDSVTSFSTLFRKSTGSPPSKLGRLRNSG